MEQNNPDNLHSSFSSLGFVSTSKVRDHSTCGPWLSNEPYVIVLRKLWVGFPVTSKREMASSTAESTPP